MDEVYTLGQWHGLPRYACKFCPFDTLNEAEAREHYRVRHAPAQAEPPPSGLVLVADKRGREVADASLRKAAETDLIQVDEVGMVEVEYVELEESLVDQIVEEIAPDLLEAGEKKRKRKRR